MKNQIRTNSRFGAKYSKIQISYIAYLSLSQHFFRFIHFFSFIFRWFDMCWETGRWEAYSKGFSDQWITVFLGKNREIWKTILLIYGSNGFCKQRNNKFLQIMYTVFISVRWTRSAKGLINLKKNFKNMSVNIDSCLYKALCTQI